MGAGLPSSEVIKKKAKVGKKFTLKLESGTNYEVIKSENADTKINKNIAEIIPQKKGIALVKIKFFPKFKKGQREGPLYSLYNLEIEVD